jgi:hypothetical protein
VVGLRAEADKHGIMASEAQRYRDLADDAQQQLNIKEAEYKNALSRNAGLENTKASTTEYAKALTEGNSKLQALQDEITRLNNQLGVLDQRNVGAAQNENSQFVLESLVRLMRSYGGEQPNKIASGSAAGLADVLGATGFTQQQIVSILNQLHAQSLSFSTVLAEIDRRITAVTGQINQNAGYNRQ